MSDVSAKERKAANQRLYRNRHRQSVKVYPIPLPEDVARILLMRAGNCADLAARDRRAAGEALGQWLESHEF
jgi:hypothetical protein